MLGQPNNVMLKAFTGLEGGVCGALVGAIMGLNRMIGLDIRQMSYPRTLQDFMLGHINLLRKNPAAATGEPFAAVRRVLNEFREIAGGMECSSICGKRFADYPDFCNHMSSSFTCADLVDKAAGIAIMEIKKWP